MFPLDQTSIHSLQGSVHRRMEGFFIIVTLTLLQSLHSRNSRRRIEGIVTSINESKKLSVVPQRWITVTVTCTSFGVTKTVTYPTLLANYNLLETRIESAIRQLGYFGKISFECVVGHISRLNPHVRNNISNKVRVVAAYCGHSNRVPKQTADHEIGFLLDAWLRRRKKEVGVVVLISSDGDMCVNVGKVQKHGSAIIIMAKDDYSTVLQQAVNKVYL